MVIKLSLKWSTPRITLLLPTILSAVGISKTVYRPVWHRYTSTSTSPGAIAQPNSFSSN